MVGGSGITTPFCTVGGGVLSSKALWTDAFNEKKGSIHLNRKITTQNEKCLKKTLRIGEDQYLMSFQNGLFIKHIYVKI